MTDDPTADPGERTVTLVDGSTLVVRPISPDDREDLDAGFRRWSAESRYRRFLGGVSELRPRLLDYLTSVDHHGHEALVARDAATGEGVAVGRFIRDKQNPRRAEMALAVGDDWHGRGVGTALLALLVDRAREEGVDTFTASVLAENTPMIAVLASIGEPHVVGRDGSVVELEIPLPAEGVGEHLAGLLRAAAAVPHA
jgi:RimJ/RimL family protein N-acetyltransferase